jgi:hypothetical protein
MRIKLVLLLLLLLSGKENKEQLDTSEITQWGLSTKFD